MIGDITIFIVLAAGSFAAMILFSIGINLFLHPSQEQNAERFKKMSAILKLIFFVLFLILGFSLLPIILKFFLEALTEVIPGSELPRTLMENGMIIVYAVWLLYLAGMALAIPAMIKSGFFEPETPANNGTTPS